MALNFNLLAQEGPKNLYEGFEQGRQAVAQNALAQQKLAQEGEMMSMRRQEFQSNLESSQAERRRKATVEKTAMFRDRILRAPTPQAARELVRMQHSDPDLGPVMQQLGSLDQDLADIPDDPTGFESWRQREAMGAAEFIKSQASERGFQDLLARVRGGQPSAAAPAAPLGELVAAPITPPAGVMREIAPGGAMGAEMPLAPTNALAPVPAQTNAMAAPAGMGRTPAQIRAEIDQLSMSSDPRAVRMVQTLTKEYEAALRGGQNRPFVVGNRLVSPTGQELYVGPQGTASLPVSIAEFERAKTDPAFMQFLQDRAAAIRPPAAPRQEPAPQAPVAVVDPATGKQVLVSREEALTRRMTPAAAMESLPPKEIQKREAAFPQATSVVKGIESKATGFIKDLEELRDHPGLSSITGIAAGRLPGITAEGRAAEAIYDKIVAKGGFQALQEMRDASKTGGALGNVSNQEGAQLKASFAAIDRRQEAKDVQKAIREAIEDIQRTTVRMREAYDSTYSYKSEGSSAATPTRSLTPQDQEALNWANSNPNDPRAAQIKQLNNDLEQSNGF
jgi:hypothetical protein